jgi:hypothetical protein
MAKRERREHLHRAAVELDLHAPQPPPSEPDEPTHDAEEEQEASRLYWCQQPHGSPPYPTESVLSSMVYVRLVSVVVCPLRPPGEGRTTLGYWGEWSARTEFRVGFCSMR